MTAGKMDMTDLEASGVGEHPPPYMIFLVVFLFFLTGLSGFLICHLLKMKGYRCRTGDMESEEEEEEEEQKLGGSADEEDEENQDTVEQILKCIIENEANMEAFNEMLGNRNVCVRHDPRLRKESIGGVPSHHHTVHSGTEHNSCHLCAQARSKKGRRHSRTARSKQRPGEQTVFSVGRFRVTHTDKKLHGSSTAVVGSGDLLDQSQDSEEQKGGYNLRNMFKDVRPASDTTNGFVPYMGKRRRSGAIFGLRRGSDPVGLKTVEQSISRQGGGLKFAFQKQPVVLEELVQTENPEEPAATTDEKLPQNEKSSSRHAEDKVSRSVDSLPSQRKQESQPSVSVSEPHLDLLVGPPAVCVPLSLTISSPTEPTGNAVKKELTNEGSPDPGPVQTSTPTAAGTGSTPGFTSVLPTDHPDLCSSKGDFPVTQSPPDPCSSPDLEAGCGSSLAFISLGSSPQSSLQNRTPSLSSLSETPSPPSEVRRGQTVSSSPARPPSGAAVFSQSPSLSRTKAETPSPRSPTYTGSPRLKSGRVTSTGTRPESEETAETLSPPSEGGSKKHFSEDRVAGSSPSPCKPWSPPVSPGGRISSVVVVKANSDSHREFSVVTMVEDGKPPGPEPEPEPEVNRSDISPAAAEATLRPEKDDMVEMEDIRDCRVTQERGEDGRGEEEVQKVLRR